MGDLLLCSRPLAKTPYYLDAVSVQIYSMEELCYVIWHDSMMLDSGFMSLELCNWIQNEMDLVELADELRAVIMNQGALSEFVVLILKAVGYCTKDEMKAILLSIGQLEEKSDFERGKIRADKLLESGRCVAGIYEYRQLLNRSDLDQQSRMLVGNVWHNLGCAYARLFLYEEACACFDKAYSMNSRMESLKELLYAALGMDEENDETFRKAIQLHSIDNGTVKSLKAIWVSAAKDEDLKQFQLQLESLQELRKKDRSRYQKEVHRLLEAWKEDYRRICKL